MIILALDIATRTGVAVGKAGTAPVCFSEDLGKGQSEDARFSKALILTDRLIREHKPDLIAVEAAVGGRDTSHYLVGILACVRGCAFNRKVPLKSYHSGSIRKHFVGKALTTRDFPNMSKAAAKKEIKIKVWNRCRALNYRVPLNDYDAADAAALFDYACAMERVQVPPSGELFT